MTEITQFVKQLDPTLDRRRIIGELETVRETLIYETSVSGRDALEVLDRSFPATGEARSFSMRVIGAVRFPDKDRWYNTMIQSLNIALSFIDVLKGMVNSEFPPKLDTPSITYRQATILGIASNLNEYAQTFDRITTWLLNEAGAHAGGVANKPLPGEIAITKDAEHKFLSFMPFLFLHERDLKQYIKSTPDTVVDAESESVVTALGRNSWFSEAHFATPWNPFYTYSKWRAEAQANQYNQRKEQRRAQQLRLLELRGLAEEDGETAMIQKQIQLTSSRINKIDAKLKEFEEDYLSD